MKRLGIFMTTICQSGAGTTDDDHFQCEPIEFVGVTTPTLIYIGVKDRADFDKIALPLQDHGAGPNGHVLSKRLGEFTRGTPTIVFQHWLKRLTFKGIGAQQDAKKAAAELQQ